MQDIPLILETPTFEAVEVWECEIKVLNQLSEVGAGSGSSVEEKRNTSQEDMLNGMVGDIRNVIQEYRDHKEKVGRKKSISGKVKSRRRKVTNDEEDGEATDSEDAQSCAERQ